MPQFKLKLVQNTYSHAAKFAVKMATVQTRSACQIVIEINLGSSEKCERGQTKSAPPALNKQPLN